MSEWIETELKLGIPDEVAWRWIRARLGPGRVVRQQNHFFDRPDGAFGEARLGVRLRAEASARVLTVKGERSDQTGQAITRRLEVESPLGREEFDRAIDNGLMLSPWISDWRALAQGETRDRRELDRFLDLVAALAGDSRLQRYGGFDNRRETLVLALSDTKGPLDIELELDRTEYPGGRIDFEIEVERSSERGGSLTRTHRALVEWLESEGGIASFGVESKLARLSAILEGSSDPSTS